MSNDTELSAIKLIKDFDTLEESLVDVIKKLPKTDRKINTLVDVLFKEFMGLIEKAAERSSAIKSFLNDHPSIKISDPYFRKRMQAIRDEKTYSHKIIQGFISLAKDMDDNSENDFPEGFHSEHWLNALFEEGTASYVDNSFHRRKKEVSSLIIGSTIPKTTQHHFALVQEVYALGLFEVTIVFLRSLLETALFDFLKKRGEIKDLERVSEFDSFRSRELLRRTKKHIRKHHDDGASIIDAAGSILHSKQKVETINEKFAFNAIKTSMAIIEELYR